MMNQKRTLSNRWILRNDDKSYIAYDAYKDMRVKLSESLFNILSIFKYYSVSINELSNKIKSFDKATIINNLLLNSSLPDILIESDIPYSEEFNLPYPNFLTNSSIVKKYPTDLEIHLTEKCNLKCRHCAYSCSPTSEIVDIEPEKWIQLFDELERYDVLKVVLSGGELFSYKGIDIILEDISKRRFRTEILTNGLLIRDKHLKYFTPNIGLNISLDGNNIEDHEFLRGKNTFKRTVETINKLKNNIVYISTVISKKNMFNIEDIIKFVLTLEVNGLNISLIDHIGRAETDKELHLCKEERILLNKTISDLIIKYGGDKLHIQFVSNSDPDTLRSKKNNNLEINYSEIICCSAANYRVAISANGDVYPCVYSFDDVSMNAGNIKHTSLLDIWYKNKWNILRGGIQLHQLDECKNCNLVNNCTMKTCRLRSLSYNKDMYAAPYNCPKKVYT